MQEAHFIHHIFSEKSKLVGLLPDKELTALFVEELFCFLFTGNIKGNAEEDIANQLNAIRETTKNLLTQCGGNIDEVNKNVAVFFESVPGIFTELSLDAQAILKFDPAANSLEEVLLAYPGFFAIAVYRLAHQFHVQKIKLLPRMMCAYSHSKTGIDIHPAALIGKSFFIDHGTGVVIGETTVIGNDVKIYQGVTLGALNVSKAYANKKRHPTISDNVVIYAGATILGGETVIGSGSVIGGNVWLTYSVAPNSIVYHKSEIKIRDNNPLPEAINFVI